MSANRIILVEDDIDISETIALSLRYAGYECAVYDDGAEAAACLERDHGFDLALLDIMLPGLDGFELLGHMKKYDIPVIYMTARTDSGSEIKLLRGGAEDYVVKPFEMLTLLVRIEKVLERTGRLSKIYRCGNITLNVENRTVTKCDEEVELTPLEFDVLLLLMKNKNRTVSRERLLDEIWGEDYFGDLRTVDVRVANIRRKLGLHEAIRTVSKAGYRLEER